MTNYEILGISRDATKVEIKRAYRQLSMRYHPDMPGGDSGKFLQIKEAYEQLMSANPLRIVKDDSWINVTHHMYSHGKGTMDLHVTSSSDFVFAEGTFGNKTCKWSMVNKTHHILHISENYMQSSFKVVFVNRKFDFITHTFNFDIPKKTKPDVKIKVKTKSSDNSCIGCIGQVIILWIIIEVIKYFFNIK